MHPLRVVFIVSLTIGLVIAVAFGAAIEKLLRPSATTHVEAIVVGAAVFAAFLVPWAASLVWTLRRAADLDELTVRARTIAGGQTERHVTDRPYHEELDDLARYIEELRSMIVRQQGRYEEHQAVMNQIGASVGEGLLAVGPDRSVVFANARTAEIFGTRDAILGRPYVQFIRQASLISAVDRAIAGEASSDRLTLTVRGEDRQIEMRVQPVPNSKEIAAVALFIDFTQLERLQRIRKEFLDDFSHEVRTPLAALRGAVETMEAEGLTAEQQEQLRKILGRQLVRLEHLVRDLAELNRIESGELVLDREPVDLHGLLEDLFEEFRVRAGERSMRLKVTGDTVVAKVDPNRIQQVFTNLLDNAVKYGRGEVVGEVVDEGAEVLVRISDRGEGIPPGELTRVFHRFYRVDRSRSQETPGIGLGLAITKHLVLQHGGWIQALNREGGGAVFEVRLPK